MQGSGTFWKLRFYIYTQYEGLGLHFKHTHTHAAGNGGEGLHRDLHHQLGIMCGTHDPMIRRCSRPPISLSTPASPVCLRPTRRDHPVPDGSVSHQPEGAVVGMLERDAHQLWDARPATSHLNQPARQTRPPPDPQQSHSSQFITVHSLLRDQRDASAVNKDDGGRGGGTINQSPPGDGPFGSVSPFL